MKLLCQFAVTPRYSVYGGGSVLRNLPHPARGSRQIPMTNLRSQCPKCGQSIRPRDLNCPTCLAPLKAHGHPGMTIHYAQGIEFLCETCELHADNSCTLAKRPHARDCTLYLNREQLAAALFPKAERFRWRGWLRRNRSGLLLMGIVIIALVLALLSQ